MASNEERKCTCGMSMGHARSCATFTESMMQYDPFARSASADIVNLIVRDCCETMAADPDLPDTLCIDVEVLREIVSRHATVSASANETTTGLGWRVREMRAANGSLTDCFVEAPAEGDMPYGLQVLGDDYAGYGNIERKYEHCKMIVAWANRAASANETGAEGADIADFAALIDDYQCAQIDGENDERANARIALLNAYRAALSRSPAIAVEAVAIPAGYVLVPVEPTPAMLDRAVAFALNVKIGGEYRWTNYMVDLWAAFLAAAPQSPAQAADNHIADELVDTLKLAIGYIGSSIREDRHEHIARIRALLAAQPEQSEPHVATDSYEVDHGTHIEHRPIYGHPETAAPARIEQLRKALFEARDAMRVMSEWAKKPDPAGHSWAVRMVDRANATLNGEPEPRAEVTDTERLDWLIENGHMKVQGSEKHGYRVWDCSDGLATAGDGATAREAIDAARAGGQS